MKAPDFLFIGPDKTGSTWLYHILRRHPECYVPPVKDIYFFDRHYARGLDWYLSFFADAPASCGAVGELSHDYLFSPLVAERIRGDLPHVRLITSLRDPSERTFSHYLHMVRSGRTRLSFDKALREFPELIENSRYHKHLSEYLRRFERERILVLFFEDLERDPRAYAFQVFDFLGVRRLDELDYSRRFMPASHPRSVLAAALVRRSADAARRFGFTRLVGLLKHSPLTRLLYRPYTFEERPRLAARDRQTLVEWLRPDIEALQGALGRDLSGWLAPTGGRGVPERRSAADPATGSRAGPA